MVLNIFEDLKTEINKRYKEYIQLYEKYNPEKNAPGKIPKLCEQI